ncbi:Uncharacterised protein [Neisseria meningitidis]|nr:Uncharacterised protein [Neisseria meningitidis]CWR41824.1 Uncharacterised protein [Neisseria meningitidis]
MPSETACRVSDGISRSNLFFPVKHHRLHRRARQAFGQRQHRHQPHGKRIFQHRLPRSPPKAPLPSSSSKIQATAAAAQAATPDRNSV